MRDLTGKGGESELHKAANVGEFYDLRGILVDYVQEYRSNVLDGKLLTEEEVRKFVRSLANQRASSRWFADHDVSPTAHNAEWLPYDPGVGLSEAGELEEEYYVQEGRIAINPPDLVLFSNPGFKAQQRVPHEMRRYLYIPEETNVRTSVGKSLAVELGRHSVLDISRRRARTLVSEVCPHWTESQAA